jgi:hypothetical protein
MGTHRGNSKKCFGTLGTTHPPADAVTLVYFWAGNAVWYGYRPATEMGIFGARANASKTGKIKWANTTIF